MNRLQALCIKYNPEWMSEQGFQSEISKYGIEWTVGIEPKWKFPVIWLSWHDEQIFYLAQGDMEILYGLHLWFDDGEQEVKITEKNYREYNPLEFYKDRTGKYDIEEEI